eukprot:TRINITY_DN5082_c0_g1_i1.p1 TRINITY_DN5082_c0_g1~~TRINITY_DN5082_c0_g1_i1.p1  ORF type:complete len:184 (-),score=3.24 TRINITY_DN5082_c0_g1_i1:681-1232(-)
MPMQKSHSAIHWSFKVVQRPLLPWPWHARDVHMWMTTHSTFKEQAALVVHHFAAAPHHVHRTIHLRGLQILSGVHCLIDTSVVLALAMAFAGRPIDPTGRCMSVHGTMTSLLATSQGDHTPPLLVPSNAAFSGSSYYITDVSSATAVTIHTLRLVSYRSRDESYRRHLGWCSTGTGMQCIGDT